MTFNFNSTLLIVIIILLILFFILIAFGIVGIDIAVNELFTEIEQFTQANLTINPKTMFNINYGQNPIPIGFQGTDFCYPLSIFLARCELSAIIYGSRTLQGLTSDANDLQLPPQLSIAGKVGNRAILLQRTGTNFFILANRGTLTSTDILNDIAALQTQFVNLDGQPLNNALVQQGFYQDWQSLAAQYNAVWNSLPENSQLAIVGHSEGVAHAQFTAVSYQQKPSKNIDIALYIYAPPRVGNNSFTDYIDVNIPNSWHISNQTDFIPDLPPSSFVISVDNYLYDELKQQVHTNLQVGSLSSNHYMDTYLCSLYSDANECQDINIVWQEPAQILRLLNTDLQAVCALT